MSWTTAFVIWAVRDVTTPVATVESPRQSPRYRDGCRHRSVTLLEPSPSGLPIDRGVVSPDRVVEVRRLEVTIQV